MKDPVAIPFPKEDPADNPVLIPDPPGPTGEPEPTEEPGPTGEPEPTDEPESE